MGAARGVAAGHPLASENGPVTEALVDTGIRFVTWNVWGRYGPWEQRQAGISAALAGCAPDVVALQEAWSTPDRDQAGEQAAAIGLPYHHFFGNRADSGQAVLSRWPLESKGATTLPGPAGHEGVVWEVAIDGPRGVIRLFTVMLDWPPHHSSVRQGQVEQLVTTVRAQRHRGLTVVCGDFNTGPDTDEIRMITGRTARDVCWHDAWDLAGDGPGATWSRDNPWAAPVYPRSWRIDYLFTTSFGPGGIGHPLRAELVGTKPIDAPPSDHFGLCVDVRY